MESFCRLKRDDVRTRTHFALLQTVVAACNLYQVSGMLRCIVKALWILPVVLTKCTCYICAE